MTKQKIKGVAECILANLGSYSITNVLLNIESEVLTLALEASSGNCQNAASALGLNRTTLVEKRKRFGLKMHQPYKRYA